MSKYITTSILEYYNEKIKEHITNADESTVEQIKSYIDRLIKDSLERIKYKISDIPKGTLVDYGDKEIRIMCPYDTEWVKQDSEDPNKYYVTLKTYAPNNAVSFKKGVQGVVEDKMFTFDDETTGIDEFGTNYSITLLPIASYDETMDVWTYFGNNSSVGDYFGWDYIVEWYDLDGVIIESNNIRINLSNEECHHLIEPYYLNDVVEKLKTYTDEKIEERVEEVSVEVFEF